MKVERLVRSTACVHAGFVIVLALGTLLLWWGFRSCRSGSGSPEGGPKDFNVEAFRKEIDRFLTIPGLAHRTGEGYLRGKVLIVRTDNKNFGGTTQLGDILRPSTPAEVGTVVWLTPANKREVGQYSDKTKAFVEDLEVTVIDFGASAIVAERTFEGEPPPDTKYSHKTSGAYEEMVGRPEFENVKRYILSLPQR